MTESGGGVPGDHQRLAWTTTTSQQQCYQNYSSYYTNMDYLSPAMHQLNIVVRFVGIDDFGVVRAAVKGNDIYIYFETCTRRKAEEAV